MDYFRFAMILFLVACAAYVLWHALFKPWLKGLSEEDEMEELKRDRQP